jgi:hypothetical protein
MRADARLGALARKVLARSNAQLMMIGHVTLTLVDPDCAASHSKPVVDGIVRKKWKLSARRHDRRPRVGGDRLVNEMSLLIKVTPVLAVVGVVDITRAAVRIGAETYEPLPPFLVAVALYAPIIFGLVSLQRFIERREAAAEAA